MAFSSRQISPDKWGIYSEASLIATVSCKQTCETIMANLANGRRDAPASELNELYQVPQLKPKNDLRSQGRPAAKPSTLKRQSRKKKKEQLSHPASQISAKGKAKSTDIAERAIAERAIAEKVTGKIMSAETISPQKSSA
ncbi:MAG: hypothetical protein ACFB16_20400 [Phormidesmis sp.]